MIFIGTREAWETLSENEKAQYHDIEFQPKPLFPQSETSSSEDWIVDIDDLPPMGGYHDC